jgi:hypothetical protein
MKVVAPLPWCWSRNELKHIIVQKKKKRIESWSTELQMLQILRLAVWGLSSAQNSRTSASTRINKGLEHGALYAKFFRKCMLYILLWSQ